jgi:MauM/NapG family ferredoxin protein
MRFQRLVQVPLFLLFVLLLWLAAYPLPSWFQVDLFLRLDPLISLGTMATARAFIPRVAWALILLGLALILGRLFCGYLCPMGSTVDFFDWLNHGGGKRGGPNSLEASGRYRNWKYLLLVFVMGTSLIGLSSVFLFSPISLVTRFYSFVLYPMALMLSNLFLDLFRPLFSSLGLGGLAFAHYRVPSFDTNLFVASLVLAILLLGRLQPRFWCRNLCPAGAIFALFSRNPIFRRIVSEDCIQCGICMRSCPMGAISEDFKATSHAECILCLKCQEICPERAVSFKAGIPFAHPAPGFDLGRRKIIAAGIAGVSAAAITATNLHHLYGSEHPQGGLRSSRLIRPPGALPEMEFQARCVRCGECVKGCLTNTLQPLWLESGLSGLWTPAVTARFAGCEQNCNLCGQICPTGAIRALDPEEKKFAKIGTARVITSRCIAWEQGKRCLICDEICPYNAISSQFVPGHKVTVPIIDENRCNGCGYCENKCPVTGEAAVVVEPAGELRLSSGSYGEKAQELGLVFHAKTAREDSILFGLPASKGEGPAETPSGQLKGPESGLPPGFILKK